MGIFFGILQQPSVVVPFQPSDISGLVGWYGDTMNGVARSSITNGTTLSTWNNLATGFSDLTTWSYATGNVTVVDGAYYKASGTHAGLQGTTTISGSQTRTSFVVYNYASLGGTYKWTYILGNSKTQGQMYADCYDRCLCWISKADKTTVDSTGSWNLSTVINTGTKVQDIRFRRNGADNSKGTFANGSVVLNTGGYIATAGAMYGNADTYEDNTGTYLKEMIFYDRELNATEIGQVETWLNDKYSIY